VRDRGIVRRTGGLCEGGAIPRRRRSDPFARPSRSTPRRRRSSPHDSKRTPAVATHDAAPCPCSCWRRVCYLLGKIRRLESVGRGATTSIESITDCSSATPLLGCEHFPSSSPRLCVGVYPSRASNPHPTCRTSPLVLRSTVPCRRPRPHTSALTCTRSSPRRPCSPSRCTSRPADTDTAVSSAAPSAR
jgi:hypothetical protein